MANSNKSKTKRKPLSKQPKTVTESLDTIDTLIAAAEPQEAPQNNQAQLDSILEMVSALTASVATLREENVELKKQVAEAHRIAFGLEQQVLNSARNEAVLVNAYRQEPTVTEMEGKYSGITRSDS